LFDRTHKQDCEWYEKPANHQEHAQYPPRLGVSGNEEVCLFWKVCVPDEHVLAEADVGPENAKRQHPFSHDLIMLDGNHAPEITRLTQGRDHENEERHRSTGCAGEDVHAKHG
jgi:hypothetical protein